MASKQDLLFTIKCQCSVYKNDILITSKKKSKLSNLALNPKSKIISVVPFNSKQQQIVFELKKLKNIHRKFIAQGKITLQFNQDSQKISRNDVNIEDDNKIDRLSKILVDAASSQNLQLLIKKIVDLMKQIKAATINNNKRQKEQLMKSFRKTNPSNVQPQINMNKAQKRPEKQQINLVIKKKMIPSNNISNDQEFKKQQKINRKLLMSQAFKPVSQVDNIIQSFNPKTLKKQQFDILQLPTILLQKVFEYVKVQLKMRLINKKFDEFVLRNINTLYFKDQVDEQCFNKMAKSAINIQGRLKNVKNLTLIDKNNQSQQLQKNKAKSLYFGQWKQISKRNLLQIKFLHVHTLQIPYQIKFQFQNIYGIRLRQIHLKSKFQVSTPNYFVKDQNILYLFNNISTLESFSIPYINSSVLDEIAKIKERKVQIRSLQFGTVNQNKKDTAWYLFHVYQNLKKLKVQRILQGGLVKRDLKYKLTFPMFIQQLQIGSILDEQILRALPTTLRKLKLIGNQYLNRDIQQIFLPYLRYLDINECPLIRPSMIQALWMCSQVKIITNWQKQDIDYYKQTARQKNVQIVSVFGMIKK